MFSLLSLQRHYAPIHPLLETENLWCHHPSQHTARYPFSSHNPETYYEPAQHFVWKRSLDARSRTSFVPLSYQRPPDESRTASLPPCTSLYRLPHHPQKRKHAAYRSLSFPDT